jgi:hypothetical protein
MAFRRSSAILGALAVAVAMSAASPSFAQNSRKLTKEELDQYGIVRAQLDAFISGKAPAPTDAKVTFKPHFLKSGTGIYIPYTVELEPGKLSTATAPLVMYVVAVKKPVPGAAPEAAPAAPAPARGGAAGRGGRGAPPSGPTFAFEDVSFVTPKPDGTIQRAIELMPGDYNVYVTISEKPADPKDKKATPAKAVISTQALTVPNLLTGLSTSSIILAKNIEPATAQLTGMQQLEEPYTVSGYKITPSPVSSFSKSGELLWVFYIYNEGAAAGGKPDVTVDYNFFRAGEEKPFVNMPSSSYNAANLPPEFNLASGHMVFVATGVPLSAGAFTPGDYKLQIKITDKTNNESVTRDVPFTVTP